MTPNAGQWLMYGRILTIEAVKSMAGMGNWEVVLDSFEFNQKVSDTYFSSSADEGNKFLVLNYTVTNEGTEADNFTSMIGGVEMKAIFKDKYEYKYTITMISYNFV